MNISKYIGKVSPDVEAEIRAYSDMMDNLHSNLEAQFAACEMTGNIEKKREIFDTMINYAMISASDPRLLKNSHYKTTDEVTGVSKKTGRPLFKRVKIAERYTGFDYPKQKGDTTVREAQSHAMYRLRHVLDDKEPGTTGGYMGIWKFGRLPYRGGTILQNVRHWGIRRELQYECPTTFPSNVWPFTYELMDGQNLAEMAADIMSNILQKNGAVVTPQQVLDQRALFGSGYQRVYTIKNVKWPASDQNIGIIKVAAEVVGNEIKPVATVYIDWSILIKHFIMIRPACDEFIASMKHSKFFGDGVADVKIDQTGLQAALDAERAVVEKNNAYAMTKQNDPYNKDSIIEYPW